MSCKLSWLYGTDWACLNQHYAGILQTAIHALHTLILVAGVIITVWQIVVLRNNIKGGHSLNLVRAHREIMEIALRYPFLLKLLNAQEITQSGDQQTAPFTRFCSPLRLVGDEVAQARLFYSMLINHMYIAHQQFNLHNIPTESWRGHEPDIRDFFTWHISRARWQEVRP